MPVFPFAGSAASVVLTDKKLEFSLYDKDFPTALDRRLWLENELDGANPPEQGQPLRC